MWITIKNSYSKNHNAPHPLLFRAHYHNDTYFNLFLGAYNATYVISMLTGLVLFFYYAACITKTARVIQKRPIHQIMQTDNNFLASAPYAFCISRIAFLSPYNPFMSALA